MPRVAGAVTATSHRHTASITTGPDGRFDLPDVAPGEGTLSVYAPNGWYANVAYNITAGQRRDLGDVAIKDEPFDVPDEPEL